MVGGRHFSFMKMDSDEYTLEKASRLFPTSVEVKTENLSLIIFELKCGEILRKMYLNSFLKYNNTYVSRLQNIFKLSFP